MKLKYIFIITLLLGCFNAVAQDSLQFKSRVQQTTMIELYSSQGCSSCPPAERWISRYLNDASLWKDTVPVVFHVDYWNKIGWVDPFSNASNSQRQRNYYHQGKINSVYTPGFIINGKEWRGGEYSITSKAPGVLRASLKERNLKVEFENKGELVLHVSILGIGLKTDIKSGENSGKTMMEDFVALSHQRIKSDKGVWQVKLPYIKQGSALRYGLAIWVSYPEKNTPIQSAGTWLPEGIFGS